MDSFYLLIYSMLGMEPRALSMLGKHSVTKLCSGHPPIPFWIRLFGGYNRRIWKSLPSVINMVEHRAQLMTTIGTIYGYSVLTLQGIKISQAKLELVERSQIISGE